jgi:hypothetical protein
MSYQSSPHLNHRYFKESLTLDCARSQQPACASAQRVDSLMNL